MSFHMGDWKFIDFLRLHFGGFFIFFKYIVILIRTHMKIVILI